MLFNQIQSDFKQFLESIIFFQSSALLETTIHQFTLNMYHIIGLLLDLHAKFTCRQLILQYRISLLEFKHNYAIKKSIEIYFIPWHLIESHSL